MTSFKRTLIRMVNKKAYEREYFEEVIATWLIKGYLTEEEADESLLAIENTFNKVKNKEA